MLIPLIFVSLLASPSCAFPQHVPVHRVRSLDCIAIEPAGLVAASGGACESNDGYIRIWDARSGVLRKELNVRGSTVKALAFDNTAHHLASGTDRQLSIWDLRSGRTEWTHETPVGISALRFAGAGVPLVVGEENGQLSAWNPVSHQKQWSCRAHAGPIVDVTFSRKGRILATAGMDGHVKIFNVDSGRVRAALRFHGPVTAVGFSPDGKSLAVAVAGDWTTIKGKTTVTLTDLLNAARAPGLVSVYQTGSWESSHEFKLGRGQPTHLVFCRNALMVARTNGSLLMNECRMWLDVWSTGPEHFQLKATKSAPGVICVASAERADLIATGRVDGRIESYPCDAIRENP